MSNNVFIFTGGVLTGAALLYMILRCVGEEKRRIIFGEAKNSPDEKIEEASEETAADSGNAAPIPIIDKVSDEYKDFTNYVRDKTDYTSFAKVNDDAGDDSEDDGDDSPYDISDDIPEQAAGIYPITPDDFNEMGSYTAVTLTYYSDGIMTDSSDNVIDDISELLGDWSKDMIGQYEPDVAYVRNDYLMQDFEILRDLRRYEDVIEEKPYLPAIEEDYD